MKQKETNENTKIPKKSNIRNKNDNKKTIPKEIPYRKNQARGNQRKRKRKASRRCKMKINLNLQPNKINGISLSGEQTLYFDGQLFEIIEGFKNAVELHNTSAVLLVDGRSGTGKTTLSSQIAFGLDKDFGLHKIHFTPKSFLEGNEDGSKIGLSNCKKGDCIIFDEAMLVSNRASMSQINKMVIQAMSMIRSKRIYVIFNVNSIFDIDKNLALHRSDILLHVYGQTLRDRGRFSAFFRAKDGYDRLKMLYLFGKKFYDYSRPKANFIGRFTKKFLIDEKMYENEKQKGINEFLKGSTKKSYDRDKVIMKMKENGTSSSEIAILFGLSRRQVNHIIDKFKKNEL